MWAFCMNRHFYSVYLLNGEANQHPLKTIQCALDFHALLHGGVFIITPDRMIHLHALIAVR